MPESLASFPRVRRIGPCRMVWVLALVCLPACRPQPSHTTAIASIRPLEQCELPADSVRHVIVLDRSGSMRTDWPVVQRQLGAIVAALPEGNWLRVEGFDGRTVTLIHDVQLGTANRELIVQQAQRLPEPRPLAPTDLGRAMEAGLDDLTAARARGRGRVSLVFFITDGKHEPQRDSPYGEAALFDRLRERWVQQARDPEAHVFVYAIPIGAGLEGAELIQRTIPSALTLPPRDAGGIAEAVSDIVDRVAKDVKRALVTSDTLRGDRLHAYVPGRPGIGSLSGYRVPVVLRSTAACVTYDVSALDFSSGAGLRVSGGASTVRLAPGDSAVMSMKLSAWPTGKQWLPSGPRRMLRLGADQGEPITLSARVRLEPEAAIQRLLIDSRDVAVRIGIEGAVDHGPISWLAFSSLVSVPLIGALLLAYGALPPRPGVFRPTTALDPDGDGRPIPVNRLRRDPRGRRILYTGAVGPRLWVRYRRTSRLRSPSRTRVAIGMDHPDVAAIAEPRASDGGHEVILLSEGSARELTRRSYIVWTDNERPLPRQLGPGEVELLPGYYWAGR